MSETGSDQNAPASESPPPEAVAGGSQWHPLTTAAIVGGALAATAGAYLGTRALARRHSDGSNGKRVSSVLATAITACDLAQRQQKSAPSAADIKVDRAAER